MSKDKLTAEQIKKAKESFKEKLKQADANNEVLKKGSDEIL